jgi:hypothetical protein
MVGFMARPIESGSRPAMRDKRKPVHPLSDRLATHRLATCGPRLRSLLRDGTALTGVAS